jgi:hypothetical protein
MGRQDRAVYQERGHELLLKAGLSSYMGDKVTKYIENENILQEDEEMARANFIKMIYLYSFRHRRLGDRSPDQGAYSCSTL